MQTEKRKKNKEQPSNALARRVKKYWEIKYGYCVKGVVHF